MTNPRTLESVSAAFDLWRQHRTSRKESVPTSLRDQAIKLLINHSRSRVIEALKINHSMLKQWQHKGERPASTFVALPPPNAEAASPLQITLRNPQGSEMHIAGAMTADQLYCLAQSFVSAAGTRS